MSRRINRRKDVASCDSHRQARLVSSALLRTGTIRCGMPRDISILRTPLTMPLISCTRSSSGPPHELDVKGKMPVFRCSGYSTRLVEARTRKATRRAAWARGVLGLGLQIASEVAKAHHGSIAARPDQTETALVVRPPRRGYQPERSSRPGSGFRLSDCNGRLRGRPCGNAAGTT